MGKIPQNTFTCKCGTCMFQESLQLIYIIHSWIPRRFGTYVCSIHTYAPSSVTLILRTNCHNYTCTYMYMYVIGQCCVAAPVVTQNGHGEGLKGVKLSHLTLHAVCSTANVTMVERMDTVDVKSYCINVTLNELCLNDSEFAVTVAFGEQFSNGECDLFSTNETKKITPGESIFFSPPDGTSSLSKDYCYVANLSADGIFVHSE